MEKYSHIRVFVWLFLTTTFQVSEVINEPNIAGSLISAGLNALTSGGTSMMSSGGTGMMGTGGTGTTGIGSWTAGMKPASAAQFMGNLGGQMLGTGNPAVGGHSNSLLGGTMSNVLGGPTHSPMGGPMNTSTIVPGAMFDDYRRGGLRMHVRIAVDFTISNGHPSTQNSFHYLDPTGAFNSYEQALSSVVGIIEAYDWDKRFQLHGIGAHYPRNNVIRHEFNVNHDSSDCIGVQGVLDAYRRCLMDMEPGQTQALFSPLIQKVTQSIQQSMQQSMTVISQDDYYILLILTTGQIADFEITENILATASELPLSIIIVGIGPGEFPLMVQLDNDIRITQKKKRKDQKSQKPGYVPKPEKLKKKNKHQYGQYGQLGHYGQPGQYGQQNPFSATGQQNQFGVAGQQNPFGATGQQNPFGAAGITGTGIGLFPHRSKHRDIVQFVALNQFAVFGNSNIAHVQFARALLDELPFQVESYMRSKGIMPKPPGSMPQQPYGQPMPGTGFSDANMAGVVIPGVGMATSGVGAQPISTYNQNPGDYARFDYPVAPPAQAYSFGPHNLTPQNNPSMFYSAQGAQSHYDPNQSYPSGYLPSQTSYTSNTTGVSPQFSSTPGYYQQSGAPPPSMMPQTYPPSSLTNTIYSYDNSLNYNSNAGSLQTGAAPSNLQFGYPPNPQPPH